MPTEPLRLKPLYFDRVWGGRRLESEYGRALPDDATPCGESWEVVDREEAQSVVTAGEWAGRTLHDLWENARAAVFGAGLPDSLRFPLLVKILDARERLSIQVHPPQALARELGGEPKTEMWYIAAAEPGAVLYVGLREGVDAEAFARGIAEGTTADQVHRLPVRPGDFLFLPSGRLHAIGAGLLIFEIQQNSDTTYRVFDWNRAGLDGKPRPLHVEASLRCIDFSDIEPALGRADGEVLADCAFFRVEKWEIAGAPRPCGGAGEFSIVGVVGGALRCGGERFGPGDFFLVPASASPDGRLLVPEERATVLRVTLPRAQGKGGASSQ